MNPLSAVIRIVCGLAIIAFSWMSYQKNSDRLAAGEPVLLFGREAGLSGGQATIALGVFGIIGLLLLLMGVFTLLKTKS